MQQRASNINQTTLPSAVKAVLDTAYSTLWAIRSNDPPWRVKRAKMGWLAVSGEDDTPHRPVNIYTAPFPQYDLPVTVQNSDVAKGAITITTRYINVKNHGLGSSPKRNGQKTKINIPKNGKPIFRTSTLLPSRV